MAKYNWIDRTEMRFGNLVAKEYLGNRKWKCLCDCGNETIVSTDKLSMNPNRRGTKSCGCLIGKLSKNNNFFTNIDTEEKAYIVGFIAADGCITCSKNSYYLKIRLQKNDYELLEKIKKAIGSKATIKYQNDIVHLPQGKDFHSHTASLLICNKQNVLDLIKIGLVPGKTHNLYFDFKCMNKNLYRHFLRGVYDGDGTFGVYALKNKTGGLQYETMLTGYKDFLIGIKENILSKQFPDMKINIFHAKGCADDIYRLSTNRKQDFVNLLDWFYDDSNIYLERKYKKYQELKEKHIQNSND